MRSVNKPSQTLRKSCPYSEFFWSECGKMQTRITSSTDTFHAVKIKALSLSLSRSLSLSLSLHFRNKVEHQYLKEYPTKLLNTEELESRLRIQLNINKEAFCENSQRLLVVNYLHKRASSQKIDFVLIVLPSSSEFRCLLGFT